MILKRKKPDFESLAKEAVEKAVIELVSELEGKLQDMESSLANVKGELEAVNRLLPQIRALPVKPSYTYTPEYLIYNSSEWKRLLGAARQDYEHCYAPLKSEVYYGTWDYDIETKTVGDRQIFKPYDERYLLVGGLKNKGCKGKYAIIVNGKDYITFYIDKRQAAMIFVKPFGIRSEQVFEIETLEGEQPNFELVGATIKSGGIKDE